MAKHINKIQLSKMLDLAEKGVPVSQIKSLLGLPISNSGISKRIKVELGKTHSEIVGKKIGKKGRRKKDGQS